MFGESLFAVLGGAIAALGAFPAAVMLAGAFVLYKLCDDQRDYRQKHRPDGYRAAVACEKIKHNSLLYTFVFCRAAAFSLLGRARIQTINANTNTAKISPITFALPEKSKPN